jgi:hypothetical protein
VRSFVQRVTNLPRRVLVIGAVVIFALISLVYRIVAGPAGSDGGKHAQTTDHATVTATLAHATATPTARRRATTTRPAPRATDWPNLNHQGDGPLNCAVRYRPNANGTAGWTVFASKPGVVVIHAKARDGHSYDKTWASNAHNGQATVVTTMDVPASLGDLTALGATLAADDGTFECLVGPAA